PSVNASSSSTAANRRDSLTASLASGRSTPSAASAASASALAAAAIESAAAAAAAEAEKEAALLAASDARSARDAALAECRRLALTVESLAVVCGYAARIDGFNAPLWRRAVEHLRRQLEAQRLELTERAKLEIESVRTAHAEQLSALAQQHQTTLDQQQALHSQELQSIAEQNSKAMHDSEQRHEVKLSDQASKFEAAIAELQSQLSMTQFESASLKEKVYASDAKILEITEEFQQKLSAKTQPTESKAVSTDLEFHSLSMEVCAEELQESYSEILESHPVKSESHPEKLDSHLEKSESHQEKSESHQEKSESHPEKSESHQDKSESHPEKSESHPEKSESHQEKSESHPEKSESHPKKSESHPEKSESQTKDPDFPMPLCESIAETPESSIQLRHGGSVRSSASSTNQRQSQARVSSVLDGDERPIAPLVQMQSPSGSAVSALQAEVAELQAALASYRNLPDEIASLKSVLELRTREVSEQRKQRMEAEERLAGMKEMREKAVQMQCKIENLEAILAMKTENEKLLHEKHQMLLRKFDQEYKAKSRLSMNYEELKFKMETLEQNYMSQSMAAISLSDTPPLPSGENHSQQQQQQATSLSGVMTRSLYRGIRHDREKRKTIATAAAAWHSASGDGAG
uniref:GOLGA2L5 domain-containing protein n=1 Tax=Macrostomum lignano TaxID=282301 RepID=A0A1I8GIK3_9PLAT